MATAACGPAHSPGQQSNNSGAPPLKAPHKDKKKAANSKESASRRRQAALLFLNNISLDGRPLYRGNNEPEPGSSSSNTPELFQHQRGSALPLPQVTHAVTGVVTAGTPPPAAPAPTTTTTTTTSTSSSESSSTSAVVAAALSPVLVRPSSVVISPSSASWAPGGHRWSVVGLGYGGNNNEVFVEATAGAGGSVDAMESPLSPGAGQQSWSLAAGGCRSPAPGLFSSPLPSQQPAGGVTSSSSASMMHTQRSRNVSGSPGPRAAKKVHFIKTMKQYDTRGCSDLRADPQRQRLSSVVTPDLLPALEGVELGAYNGKTVSYAPFLYPTNALVRGRSFSALDAGPGPAHTPQPRHRGNGQRGGGGITPAARINSSSVTQEQSVEDVADYDPNLLSDPQWPCGRHKRVLIFNSYVTTVIEYVKPSDLKKHMNQTFREKFPHIKLTLSKIRSLKREMRAVSEEGGLQPVTVAMAFVYFEKLVLQGRLNKNNRKLVCAACVLLAAKISSDLRKNEVKALIDRLEERFRINRRELIPLEFSVLVALEMGLYLPESMVMPHYRRLVQQG